MKNFHVGVDGPRNPQAVREALEAAGFAVQDIVETTHEHSGIIMTTRMAGVHLGLPDRRGGLRRVLRRRGRAAPPETGGTLGRAVRRVRHPGAGVHEQLPGRHGDGPGGSDQAGSAGADPRLHPAPVNIQTD